MNFCFNWFHFMNSSWPQTSSIMSLIHKLCRISCLCWASQQNDKSACERDARDPSPAAHRRWLLTARLYSCREEESERGSPPKLHVCRWNLQPTESKRRCRLRVNTVDELVIWLIWENLICDKLTLEYWNRVWILNYHFPLLEQHFIH